MSLHAVRGAALAIVLVSWLGVLAAPAAAHDLAPDGLGGIGFTQRLGAPVPRDLLFRDETGAPVRLGDYFGNGPIVLTLNQLRCPNLCPLELDGVVNGLNGLPFTLGDQFTLLTVSIDQREQPEDAANVKARVLRGYVQPAAGMSGWHVLTGDHAAIDRLAEAVGFTYAYDAANDDFAHPAGVVVLTPDAHVSRYLFGIDYSATDLRLALVDAAQQRIGSVIDRALLVCYHYDPATGRYTPFVLVLLQVGGAATVVLLGGGLLLLWRADLRRQRRPAGQAEGSP